MERKQELQFSKEIFFRESGISPPLTFCRRQASRRARNLALSRLRTIGIIKEAEDAPETANRNLFGFCKSIENCMFAKIIYNGFDRIVIKSQ